MHWLMMLLDWYKQYRLDIIKAKAEAVNRPYEAILQVAASQSEVLNKWLDGFKVTEVASSTTVRDEDEWAAEQERQNSRDMAVVSGADLFPDFSQFVNVN